MIFKKQYPSLNLSSFDDAVEDQQQKVSRHGPLLGTRQLRSLILAPSGGGKTNLMLNLLLDKNGLFYENIYLYSKTLNQPKYTFLAKVLKPLPIGFYTFSDSKEFVPLDQVKPRSIVVIDDLMCSTDQQLMREYFTQGRHWDFDVFYLCQSYAHVDKHCVRDQSNLLILFKMDDLNLRHVYDDHVSGDMSWHKFKSMCHKCWNSGDKYGFLSIFKDEDVKFRRGLDEYIYWESPDEPYSRQQHQDE